MRFDFRTFRLAAVLLAIHLGPAGPAGADQPAIKRPAAAIATAQRPARQFPSLPRNRPPRIGDRGTLVNSRASLIQKIDDSNAIGSVEWYSERKELIGDPRRGIVVDKVDNHYEMVWLHMPNKNLVNGRMFTSNQLFEVTKTVRYQSARGVQTLLYLQMVEQPPTAAVPQK
jgi:hypothetical protein